MRGVRATPGRLALQPPFSCNIGRQRAHGNPPPHDPNLPRPTTPR